MKNDHVYPVMAEIETIHALVVLDCPVDAAYCRLRENIRRRGGACSEEACPPS
jgi:hypothetical protein